MDDDDWFDADADDRWVELKNTTQEIANIEKKQHDQGYLEGLEWADTNYMLLDGQLEANYANGFQLGTQAAESRIYKFTALGQLNVMMLAGWHTSEVASLIHQLDACDTDKEITTSLREKIDLIVKMI